MNSRTGWWAAGVAVLGWVAASPAHAANPAVHPVTVERESFAFAPQELSIKVGDRVKWTNRDGQMHMVVTAKPGSEGRELEIYARMNPDENIEHQFDTASVYHYYCAIHFEMWGIISVNP